MDFNLLHFERQTETASVGASWPGSSLFAKAPTLIYRQEKWRVPRKQLIQCSMQTVMGGTNNKNVNRKFCPTLIIAEGQQSYWDGAMSVVRRPTSDVRLSSVVRQHLACVHSRGYNFGPIFTKLIQCIDIHKSSVPFENQQNPIISCRIISPWIAK